MKKFFIAFLFIIFLTIRAFADASHEEAPNVPSTFRGADTTLSPVSIGDLKWFEIFKDNQLQQLIQLALVRNYDLRQAIVRINAERANLGIVAANQYPQLGLSGDINATQLSKNGPSYSTSLPRTRTFGEILLNLLSFELDVWGRLRHQTEAAVAQLHASEEDRKTIITLVVSDVASAYFNLIELDSELEIAKYTLSDRQDFLHLTQLRQQGGIATLLDVRQAEELVYTASETIPNTEQFIQQTENQINLLLGNNPGSILRGLPLDAQPQPPSVPAGLPSALLERRPDIRSAEQNLIAQKALIQVARAAYFPRISLTGLLGFQSNSLSTLFTSPSRTWTFLPQVTQPIFTAGSLSSNVNLAIAQQQLALIQYQLTIQTAFREVSDALIQYRQVREVRVQEELLVSTLQDRSRLAYLRYQGGVDTLLNALDADRDLFNAQLSLTRTKRDELLSLVQLYKALGGGWQ